MNATQKNTLMQLQRVLHNITRQSEFKKLTVRLESKGRSKDVPLFKWMEKKTAGYVATWPEWAALMEKQSSTTSKPGLKRYAKQSSKPVSLSSGVLHKRHNETRSALVRDMNKYLTKSITNAMYKLESNSEFKKATVAFQKNIGIARIRQRTDLLPLQDILSPRENIASDVVSEIKARIVHNLNDLKTLPYPYRKDDHLRWNLVLIMRVQSLLKTNYVDRLSRVIAAGESQFNQLFCKEIIEGEVLPCIGRVLSSSRL